MRGVYEQPAKSRVWWICYFVDGKRHREKVGRKKDAIDLYQKRKADGRAGVKLPALRNNRGVTINELIVDALAFVSNPKKPHKDLRNYKSKAEIVRHAMGHRTAASVTPKELNDWLNEQCKTAATKNRYRAFLSLCYREGMEKGNVTVNPARLVRHLKETNSRKRFLSREEYKRLHDVIAERFPKHLSEFIVSVHTGMRLSEQYGCTWSQVHFDRKTIELPETKNGHPRTVDLNRISIEALQAVRSAKVKPADHVFPRNGQAKGSTRSWFQPCLEEAEINDYVWHSNRHTFCSWLAMAGATTLEIQQAAGHTTPAMAARYAHLSPKHRESVVERLVEPTAI
jgi:integrase